MKRHQGENSDNFGDAESETIAALLNYPSLENVFAGGSSPGLAGMKRKMRSTVAELERVVRRGSQADAEKAVRIIEAYRTTLDFLDELESRRKDQSK